MPTQLGYVDRFRRVLGTPIESDTSDSIVFASIPDNVPTKLVAEWTGKQYTKLLSSVMAGADLLFSEEADEIIWQLIKVVHKPTTLEEEEDNCINYLPSAPFVTYDPQNPYSEPDTIPDGYVVPPFHYNSDLVYPELFGFLATDVMVATDAIPIFGDWGDVLGLHFPTIKIRVVGDGQVELDLLSIQLGGYAIIKVGSPPNIFDIADGVIETGVVIVDLQADVESIPIESDLIISEEIPINSIDPIDVYIVFVPKISASLDFFGMGGGIRQIGLCGLEIASEDIALEDIRFNEANCSFEKRVGGGDWEVIIGGNDWLNCVEAMLATQAEITEAVVDAAEIISSRFLAGVAGNTEGGITINPDGSIEVGVDGVPIDDPATVGYNEQDAAIMGGANFVARGFELVLDKLDAYYGGTNGTPVTSEQSAQFGMLAYFPCDETLMNLAVSNYYSYRAANPRFLFNTSPTFERYLFCNGANAQGIKRYLIDVALYVYPKLDRVVNVLDGLLPEFYEQYYNNGLLVPSSDYIQAPCHKNDVEEWTQDWSTAESFGYTFAQTWKDKHRFQLDISGSYADADEANVVHDGLWKINTVTGVKTFVGFTLSVSGTTNVTAVQAPYQASHNYTVTIDKVGDNIGTWSISNDTALNPNVVGSTTFRFTDLGLAP